MPSRPLLWKGYDRMSKLLLTNIGMLATPQGSTAKKGPEQGAIQILKDAWVLVEDGVIAQVGTGAAPAAADAKVVDAGGNLVTPGLVDAHTHLIFGGWRQNELGMKLHGKTYLEIQNAGGGIQSTTNATRQATEEELTEKAAKALDEMMGFGVTTCEAKSGYGLATEHELKALQAQINPHFLYNTLDSIAWMCEQGRNADAVKMVHALARLFRISISKGHELIPIAKEIEHAESYLQIQKYRYKNQFTYDFEVDPECLDYYCNKITLQPIIENAINHGLDLMVDEGHIQVTVRQDGEDIVFCVRDNGVGMSQEQIASIMRHGPKDRTGIGIKNVNDRLKIYFGKEYGLHITSELDVGTCVEIRMPKIREGSYEAK